MSDLKTIVIEEIDYIIEILNKELKKCNIRSNDTNEYRYGQIGSFNKSLSLLKEFRKTVEKYGPPKDKIITKKSSISVV